MIIIIGLGNPGKAYQGTRHNIGRLVVSNWQKITGFSNFKFRKKFSALVSKGIFAKKNIILALPETFMNNSGKSVRILAKTYKLKPNNLIVIHDDIDLPLGKIKIVRNRGAAGHRGVESIIEELKTSYKSFRDYTPIVEQSSQRGTAGQAKNFIRFRIGIRPETGKPKDVEEFVLQNFNKKEKGDIKEIIRKTTDALEIALKENLNKAMQKYN